MTMTKSQQEENSQPIQVSDQIYCEFENRIKIWILHRDHKII